MKSGNFVKRQVFIFILIILAVVIVYLIQRGTNNESPVVTGNCDPGLWEHVYHKYRLEVIEECKTVTGRIEKIKHEDDGDLHILLKLDPGEENLLNDKNYEIQHGDLVIEPVCVEKVTQKDAMGSCSDYINKVKIPNIGEHVKVTGSYVLDKEHGWKEIHPITAIEEVN